MKNVLFMALLASIVVSCQKNELIEAQTEKVLNNETPIMTETSISKENGEKATVKLVHIWCTLEDALRKLAEKRAFLETQKDDLEEGALERLDKAVADLKECTDLIESNEAAIRLTFAQPVADLAARAVPNAVEYYDGSHLMFSVNSYATVFYVGRHYEQRLRIYNGAYGLPYAVAHLNGTRVKCFFNLGLNGGKLLNGNWADVTASFSPGYEYPITHNILTNNSYTITSSRLEFTLSPYRYPSNMLTGLAARLNTWPKFFESYLNVEYLYPSPLTPNSEVINLRADLLPSYSNRTIQCPFVRV